MPEHESFRHEALLYRGQDDYVDVVLPFLRDGVERGEQVMAAVAEPTRAQIVEGLGDAAAEVSFLDIGDLAANPARLMPALTALVGSPRGGRPLRILGQPMGAGGRDVEVVESRLHEGLVNLVIPPDAPLWLICPYDVDTGDPEIAAHAAHSHPVILENGNYRGSTSYTGAWYVEDLFRRALPAPPPDTEIRTFGRPEIGSIANRVLATAFRAGLSTEKSHRLAAAMRELASDATAGAEAVLRVWTVDEAVICEIEDPKPASPLAGRVATSTRAARKGLWLANQTSDLIQVRSTDAGTTVRVHTWR